MSKGLNRHEIIGNIGVEPEVRELDSGLVANFTVATNQQWKDKQTGDRKERTDWHQIVAYDKLAEIVQRYLRKGSKVYLSGRVQTRKWQDKEGIDRYTTEIIANELIMLDRSNVTDGQSPSIVED